LPKAGELLGKGETAMKAGKKDPSLASEGFPARGDRHKFRLLAENKALAAMEKHDGDRRSHDVTTETLADLGISKMQSHRWVLVYVFRLLLRVPLDRIGVILSKLVLHT
jgi:hypothetical protein